MLLKTRKYSPDLRRDLTPAKGIQSPVIKRSLNYTIEKNSEQGRKGKAAGCYNGFRDATLQADLFFEDVFININAAFNM